MRRTTAALLTFAALASATSAWAQPGRGPGGFGGPGGGGSAGLLMMAEVQKELGVTDDQKEKVTKALEGLRPQPGQGGGGNFREMTEEQRAKAMEEFRKQADERNKKVEAALKEVLTADQQKRLSELRVQREGVAGLSRGEIAEKLELTDEQKGKLRELAEAARPNFGQGGRPAGGENVDREKLMAEFQARREKLEADSLAVLTADQKAKWEEMKGKKFEFPAFGGRGAPGGAPGGRPQGNRPPRENNN
jgi:Spy/CpxP family protein refolding chaperone